MGLKVHKPMDVFRYFLASNPGKAGHQTDRAMQWGEGGLSALVKLKNAKKLQHFSQIQPYLMHGTQPSAPLLPGNFRLKSVA